MKFKFDSNQQFQIDAVNAVIDIFEGQSKETADKFISSSGLLGVYANILSLTDKEIFENVAKIQENNKIKNGATESLDFSVEMETGTGKTYVYLRTIFELNKKYGWKKFIILVPSVAIREGVIKTLKITKEHFKELYDNTPYRFYEYQSRNISMVKHFASSNNIEIMVMTMGAFNKDANVLYSERDQMQGEQPISYIQKTNPIMILDEPQNMEGEATQEKLKNFKALFKLRYSATHRDLHNLMYRLTPYDAYQLGLVKKIEVYSIVDDSDNISTAYIDLINVTSAKSTIKAKVEVLFKDSQGNIKKKKIIVKQRDDLSLKANNNQYENYVVDGLTVDAPDFGSVGSIHFKNGVLVKIGESTGESREDIIKKQITETIKLHFEKKIKLKEVDIKVLSLFFIDKVDNYVLADGFIRNIFTKEFNRIKKQYNFNDLDASQIHKGYFAMKGDKYLEREKSIAENKEAYELIMKEKEKLLSFDEPTEFIFSHSALREGWDNPNIFNICTLRTTGSTIRKRQEIGRGMRLCVNSQGDRIFERNINLLSVVANESYGNYVSQLQGEFVADGIYEAPPSPANARKRCLVKTKKGFKNNENFKEIWKRISKKTSYTVNIETKDLIERCVRRIKDINVPKPQVKVERVAVELSKKGVDARLLGGEEFEILPDKKIISCVKNIKDETKLTGRTVVEILTKADNAKAIFNNPARFNFEAVRVIREELIKDYIGQISYKIIPEQYNAEQFEHIPSYKNKIQKVDNSIYNAIVWDSEVEQKFALDLDKDERIKLFIKLPRWFKVGTPAGDYNPDWAIVTSKIDLHGGEAKEKVYFVIETKGDIINIRPSERNKIESAKKHFEVIDVRYKEMENYESFREIISNQF